MKILRSEYRYLNPVQGTKYSHTWKGFLKKTQKLELNQSV